MPIESILGNYGTQEDPSKSRTNTPSNVFALRDDIEFNVANYSILKADQLKGIAEGIVGIINLCLVEKPEVLFFLDRSARPVSILLRKTWGLLYPDIPYPKIRHMNMGYNNKKRWLYIDQEEGSFPHPAYKQIDEKGKILVVDEYLRTGESVNTAAKVLRRMYPKATVIPTGVYTILPSWYDHMDELMGLTDVNNSLLSLRSKALNRESRDLFMQDLSTLANEIARQVDAYPIGTFSVVPFTKINIVS